MDRRIRDFHREDFEFLWRIDQRCFAPGISYSRPELLTYIRMSGSLTLVVESGGDGQPMGAGAFGSDVTIDGFLVAHANRRGVGHIITIDVLPHARRAGVGSMLLEETEKRLRQRACSIVRLETAVNNTAALAFYKRHLYLVEKTIPRYYPDGVDALVLKKDLHLGAGDN